MSSFDLIHPILSSFPLGTFLVIIALEVFLYVQYRSGRETVLLNRIILALQVWFTFVITATYFSGTIAASELAEVSTEANSALELHWLMARTLLLTTIPLVPLRILAMKALQGKKLLWGTYSALLVLLLGLLIMTGSLGGRLVFEFALGVQQGQVKLTGIIVAKSIKPGPPFGSAMSSREHSSQERGVLVII